IESSSEIEALAQTAPDNGGVFLVPAFAGLGAPHWDPYARGTITGLTRGATVNDMLMQFQADILGAPLVRPKIWETTALGAAYLAGLAVGFWRDTDEIVANWQVDRRFEPAMARDQAAALTAGWDKAVARAKAWT